MVTKPAPTVPTPFGWVIVVNAVVVAGDRIWEDGQWRPPTDWEIDLDADQFERVIRERVL